MTLNRILLIPILALTVFQASAQDIIKLDSLQLVVKQAKTDTARFRALIDLSHLYFSTDYVKSMEYAIQAKDLATAKDLKKHELTALTQMGNVAIAQGDYKQAATLFFNSLKEYEELKDTSGIISMNNNLGASYDRMGEYDKALECYFTAQELMNASNLTERKKVVLPTVYNNIANIYQTKGDPKSALAYYEKALKLALEVPNHKAQGIAYNNIGKLYANELNEPDKALDYLMKGLEFREKIGDLGEIARSLIILSNFHLNQKDLAKSEEYSKRALEIGNKIGSMDIKRAAFLGLSEIEENRGNYSAALSNFKNFKTYSDSILNQQATSEITRLQLQYDFEKAEKLREEEAKQSRFKYLSTIAALSIGLILAVLITLVIRSKARQTELSQKNLAQDVEIKNKELTTNVMYLIRKNELINNVAERLLKIQRNLLPENQKIIQEIILDLQREGDNDTWKEFELRFNQVHSEFYTNLRKLYPDLSPTEEKLCAFLRLNMNSKEIAAVTQQSIKSVEVARARLRKKLNLTNTNSNLVTHLANI
ncbi:tetratricopeptide repeat protein [Mariniradius sediminis]|uniref:Tetratricopeptide repeat protein n=1 Tax=Mariniradius sediminis TaxID=2909237 RepID=A0ABS9BRW5_9BACT|nr:tetratricopeptide repeat protein [Mariniradius sediminis]MCF1750805.1 tetratricopeptide repeat protein [Mariniradius sediminis]